MSQEPGVGRTSGSNPGSGAPTGDAASVFASGPPDWSAPAPCGSTQVVRVTIGSALSGAPAGGRVGASAQGIM